MDKIFSEIFSMSVNSAWLIIAVIIVRAVLQKAPMYFRKILWGLVGFRLLIPFSFESSFSLVPHETQQTAHRVVGQVVAAPVEQGISFEEIVPVLWMAVGFAFFAYGFISYIKLRLKIIDSILVEDNIYRSEKIDSPFVCGFIKPKIYLPYGLDEVTQNCVLQHEKTHIKFADHIIKAISFVVLCIHWFNPLVWVSYFLLCKDVELSCDESVVRKYDSEGCKQYARALLELGVNKVKFTACPVAFGEVSIKTRIKSVVNYKRASKILVLVSLCLCIGVSVCFMTEPEVEAKEGELDKVVVEETTKESTESATESVTERATESVTERATELPAEPQSEPVIESVTEVSTEKVTQQTVDYEETVKDTEELYDDSIFENEEDGIVDDPLNKIIIAQPDLIDPPAPTSIYEGGSYNNLGSNSSVIGDEPSNTVTVPSINWDPAVTQAPVRNYGNTNHPHFEGNQWVY